MKIIAGIAIGALLVIGYIVWQIVKSGPLIK